MARFDHTGQQYGSLRIIKRLDDKGSRYLCECSTCGAEIDKPVSSVRAAKCEPPKYCNKCKPGAEELWLYRSPINDGPEQAAEAGGLQWDGKHWASSEIGLMQQRFYLGVTL